MGKKMLIPFILIVLLFSTILAAGCLETGRTTQSENYIVGKISVTEVTYFWGNDGPFTKQYVVSYQAVGSARQSTTMSKAEYESIKNGLVGYFLPDFGYQGSASPTMSYVIQTTIVPTHDQRIQETVYIYNTQSTANIQMIGSVYGLASNPSIGIDEIRFSIGLAPGSPAIDLTKMYIVFVTQSISPQILNQGAIASSSVFTTKLNGVTNVNSMNPNNQIEIAFKISPVKANTKMVIGLHPAVGAELLFTKNAPAKISATNVLY